jgi:hypothetical protein
MKYFLTLAGGVIVGAVLVFLFFTGAPAAKPLPGSLVTPPDKGGTPPGTAVVVLDEKFFVAVLEPILRDMNAPSLPLKLVRLDDSINSGEANYRFAAFEGGCEDKIVLLPEGSGVKTGVRFTRGKMMAALAFKGSYNVFGNCVPFNGWAQANMQLSFDQTKQTVYGQLNVEGVNLDGAPPMVGGFITPLVQGSINQRLNPLEILRAPQLALTVPVQASKGTLKARVKDVRAEIADGELRLHITYEFQAERGEEK